jgi:hypothetical protein
VQTDAAQVKIGVAIVRAIKVRRQSAPFVAGQWLAAKAATEVTNQTKLTTKRLQILDYYMRHV